MKAAVSRGAEAEPVIGLAHRTALCTSTAPVSPAVAFSIAVKRPMIGSPISRCDREDSIAGPKPSRERPDLDHPATVEP